MSDVKFNPEYYRNVARIMNENNCLPRPRLKKRILVTGWNEFLQIIPVEIGVFE